jgi:signal peptidase II
LRILIYWIIVILAVTVDQATKAAAVEVLDNGPLTLVPGLINLVHVENTSAAFSIGEGSNLLFIIIAIAFIAVASFFVWNEDDLPLPITCTVGFVAGGGLGNMIDRIMNGSVTDFISLAFIEFPVFNVADVFVTCGIVLTVVMYWNWETKLEREQEREGQRDDDMLSSTRDGERNA